VATPYLCNGCVIYVPDDSIIQAQMKEWDIWNPNTPFPVPDIFLKDDNYIRHIQLRRDVDYGLREMMNDMSRKIWLGE